MLRSLLVRGTLYCAMAAILGCSAVPPAALPEEDAPQRVRRAPLLGAATSADVSDARGSSQDDPAATESEVRVTSHSSYRDTRFADFGVPSGSFALQDAEAPAPAEAAADVEEPSPKSNVNREDYDPNHWYFSIAPYAWLLGMKGDVRVGGVKSDVDQSFSDLVKNLSYMFQGRFEAKKGGWGLMFDGTIGRLEDDSSVGPIDIDATIDVGLVFAGATRELYRGDLTSSGWRQMVVEATAGATYVDLKMKLDPSGPSNSLRYEEEWFDLAVGARATMDLARNVRGRIGGFVGGFGIGESSDLSWGVEGLAGYDFGKRKQMSITGGYRLYGFDYDRSRTELDLLLHGPVIGFVYRF